MEWRHTEPENFGDVATSYRQEEGNKQKHNLRRVPLFQNHLRENWWDVATGGESLDAFVFSRF